MVEERGLPCASRALCLPPGPSCWSCSSLFFVSFVLFVPLVLLFVPFMVLAGEHGRVFCGRRLVGWREGERRIDGNPRRRLEPEHVGHVLDPGQIGQIAETESVEE